MKGGGGQTGTQLCSIRNVCVTGQTRLLFAIKALLFLSSDDRIYGEFATWKVKNRPLSPVTELSDPDKSAEAEQT